LAGYGTTRLGEVLLADPVPEPTTWAMMILGFLGSASCVSPEVKARIDGRPI
jgi:hypothetical protein